MSAGNVIIQRRVVRTRDRYLIFRSSDGFTLPHQHIKGKLNPSKPSGYYMYSFIHQYSALRPVQQEPEPSQATGMAMARCILGKFLGVGCHCFPPPLDVTTFSARCLHDARSLQQRKVELFVGEKCSDKFWPRIRLPRNSRDMGHGTDGFTSPPKEGVLRIFSPLKIRRLRPGLNPPTWVPKASTLPLDHRSQFYPIAVNKYIISYH